MFRSNFSTFVHGSRGSPSVQELNGIGHQYDLAPHRLSLGKSALWNDASCAFFSYSVNAGTMETESDGGGSGIADASSLNEKSRPSDERFGRINVWQKLEEFIFGPALVWMLFVPWCLQPVVMFVPKEGQPGSIWKTEFFPITEEQFYYFISVVRHVLLGLPNNTKESVCTSRSGHKPTRLN